MLCKGIVVICETTGGVEIKAMGRERVEPIRSRKGEKRRGRKERENKDARKQDKEKKEEAIKTNPWES